MPTPADLSHTRRLALSALVARLRERLGPHAVDAYGYARSLDDNLLNGLTADNRRQLEVELEAGAGGESAGPRPKAHAAYSSSALAANVFARWRNHEHDLSTLSLGGSRGFASMAFERACPTGLRGTPPHLDLVVETSDRIVAVESKCIEYLAFQQANFAPAYDALVDSVAHPAWKRRFDELRKSPSTYRLLNAAQLVKHYLGLRREFGDRRPATLLYLYWEPADADSYDIFREHRRELERFSDGLSEADVRFAAAAYPELWRDWEASDDAPEWLPDHLANLRQRYDVSLADAAT